MPVYRLDRRRIFPPVAHAVDGLLALGGDLSPERLILAYSSGIFPWYDDAQPMMWHSPDPRMVLLPDALRIGKSLRRAMRNRPLRITCDLAFAEVIAACARAPRPGQDGTWITNEMRRAYVELHERGWGHSIEAWRGETLVGGLYGISLGAVFFGESMFAIEPDASKMAFVTLAQALSRWSFELIDCQVYTDHLARFGAEEWTRQRYIEALRFALQRPTRRGRWNLSDPA